MDGSRYEVVADGDEGEQDEVHAAALVVEVVGEERHEQDAPSVCLAQEVVHQREGKEEEQEESR